ncbi:hypothetical protein EST38_g11404 [Candolleomyces aberdarensis]|uniref:Uncharacterized protein n=1 Tax=Candolleomyces aberdarensis TaxID=2316362 RepID=A0A4Q2D7N9_9AGAR|nr:hypothetical protein EST38_g11404 [Candolleomyces aberdarensis]
MSVLVKRLPVFRPAKTRIPIYLGNALGDAAPTSETVVRGNTSWHKGSMSKFDGKEEPTTKAPAPVAAPVTSAEVKEDEAAAMAAIFGAQTQNWEETQEKMSQEFDNRPRIKRTSGIPRSMLKAVENPNSAEIGQGVMVTPDGGYVVAQPDSTSWQKKISRPKGLTLEEVREKMPTDPSLACPIDHKLFQSANATGEGDDQEPDMFLQALLDSIPQLQASIAQISKMLQNPNLPANVRHQTEMQHQQLQMQLQVAQMMALAFSAYQQQQQPQALANNYEQQFRQ